MTASSGALYRVGTVNVSNNNNTVTGIGTQWLNDVIAIAIGDLFTLDMKAWYEVVSVPSDTQIVLDRGFEGGASGANYAIVRNTSGTVLTRIAGQIAVQFNQKQLFLDELRTWLNSTNTSEVVTDSHGVSHAITTPSQMAVEHANRVSVVDSLVGSVLAPSKAEYFANCATVDAGMNGSGFLHYGKHYHSDGSGYEKVNNGIWTSEGVANSLRMGRTTSISTTQGASSLEFPQLSVLGALIDLVGVNIPATNHQVEIKLPPPPDGLDKKDGTGRFDNITEAQTVGGSGLSASVITRDDFVFAEVWYEAIGEKGVVYVGGAVQSGLTSWNGIALQTGNVAQGYSAFGEWDTTTTGRSAVWDNLSAAQQAKFIQDKKNGIYSDNGVLIQRRVRIRSVKGLGNDWNELYGIVKGLGGSAVSTGDYKYVRYQGMQTSVDDLGDDNGTLLYNYDHDGSEKIKGAFSLKHAVLSHTDTTICAIPIALVSRRNQGAYHPVWNSDGCGSTTNIAENDWRKWYSTDKDVSGTADMLKSRSEGGWKPDMGESGGIGQPVGSGRPDGEFYDAITAGDVKDLRKSCRKIPHAELLTRGSSMAIAAEHRGYEGCPFIPAITINNGNFASNPDGTYILSGIISGFSNTQYKVDGTSAASKDLRAWCKPLGQNGLGEYAYLSDGVDLYRISPWNNEFNLQLHKWNGGGYISGDYTGEMTNGRKLVFIPPPSLKIRTTTKSAEPTWTTIIGSPANIAATFPDGVIGEWCPQSLGAYTNGTGANIASTAFNNARKYITTLKAVQTRNNGADWGALSILSAGYAGLTNIRAMVSHAGEGNCALDSTTNSVAITGTSELDGVTLVSYKTKAHMTQDGVNGKVLAIGDVFASERALLGYGGGLVNSLIDKVVTGTTGKSRGFYPLTYHSLRADGELDSYDHEPEHDAINLANSNNSPAAKCLFTLGSNNGVAVLRIPFKEMVWDNGADSAVEVTNPTTVLQRDGTPYLINIDGHTLNGFIVSWVGASGGTNTAASMDGYGVTSGGKRLVTTADSISSWEVWDGNGWGDDNKFQIANGTNVMPDENGNEVIYGIHEIELDAFIDESEL